jgi:glycosyltransferase involved in cell wall biosynthesis
MKNIILLSNSLLIGGAEKQSVILAKLLASEHNVKYCICYGDMMDDKYVSQLIGANIEIVCLGNGFFQKFRDFFNLLKSSKCEMIISYLPFSNFLNAVVGSFCKVKYRIGGIRNSKLAYNKDLIQKYLHNYLLTSSISNSYSGSLNAVNFGYSLKKLITIPNCCENILDCRIYSPSENAVIKILTVARFVDQKDFYTSLKSIKYILDNHDCNIHYNIVGYGPQEVIITNWIRELNLSDYVTIHTNPGDLMLFYNTADIYFSTSLFEGTSNSIMEAMNSSLPIVCSKVGDNDRLVRDGYNGFIADVGDFVSFGELLLKLIMMPDLRLDFGRKSWNKLSSEFSVDVFYKKYSDIINN